MAPSWDACLLYSFLFFSQQQFFRCESCCKRVYAKCVTLPDEELQLRKSGLCSICGRSHADPKTVENDSVARCHEEFSTEAGSLSTCAAVGGKLAISLVCPITYSTRWRESCSSVMRYPNYAKKTSACVRISPGVLNSKPASSPPLREEVCYLHEVLTNHTVAVHACEGSCGPPSAG
ncbi:hypothetical protein MRX96_009869 [Rhipicephalus microplus]